MRVIYVRYSSGIPEKFTGIVKYRLTGKIEFLTNGVLHRLDGPSVIYPSGSKRYHYHGKSISKEELEFLRDVLKLKNNIHV